MYCENCKPEFLRVRTGRFRAAGDICRFPLAFVILWIGYPALADENPAGTWAAAALPRSGLQIFGMHWLYLALAGASAGLALVSAVAARFYRLNIAIRREVQEREKIESDLRNLEERSRAVAENAPFAIVITRMRDGKVFYVNPAAEKLFHIERQHVGHRPARDYWADPNDRAIMMQSLLEHGSDRRECILLRETGEPFWVLLSANRVNYEGDDAALLALMDISEQKAFEARLEDLAMTDYLTGLPNRRRFVDLGQEAVAEIPGNEESIGCLSLLALDVDEFKAVNDTYGHAGGDCVLQHIAELLRDALEDGESAGRLGGEEFGILLPGKDTVHAWERAEAIRLAVAAAPIPATNGNSVKLSVSIGAATHCGVADPEAGLSDLLRRADNALYRAKATGRNRCERG